MTRTQNLVRQYTSWLPSSKRASIESSKGNPQNVQKKRYAHIMYILVCIAFLYSTKATRKKECGSQENKTGQVGAASDKAYFYCLCLKIIDKPNRNRNRNQGQDAVCSTNCDGMESNVTAQVFLSPLSLLHWTCPPWKSFFAPIASWKMTSPRNPGLQRNDHVPNSHNGWITAQKPIIPVSMHTSPSAGA